MSGGFVVFHRRGFCEVTSKSRPACAGRQGGLYDIKPFRFSVKPIGVALAKYCYKFVVGQLQVTFGSIKEDFFIDTLRFLVGKVAETSNADANASQNRGAKNLFDFHARKIM